MEKRHQSTWSELLPEDEIARQEEMKARLHPGCRVRIKDYGWFIYSGTWDTMHLFYPEGGKFHREMTDLGEGYIRKDLCGRVYIRLPYTLLADYITGVGED